MKRPGNSITTKLLLLFLLAGLTPVAIVGAYSFYSAKKAIMRRTIDQLISVRAVKKQQVASFFTEKFRNIRILSQTEALKTFLDTRAPDTVTDLQTDKLHSTVGKSVNLAESKYQTTAGVFAHGVIHAISDP
jgi:hypothetical protein